MNIGRRKFDDYKLELLGFHGVVIEALSYFFPGTIKNHATSVGGQSACEKHGIKSQSMRERLFERTFLHYDCK